MASREYDVIVVGGGWARRCATVEADSLVYVGPGAASDASARGGVLDDLGISEDGRVATFAWNTARHLELYFAAPCTGRVLHTLNIRLFPDLSVLDNVRIACHLRVEHTIAGGRVVSSPG